MADEGAPYRDLVFLAVDLDMLELDLDGRLSRLADFRLCAAFLPDE